MLLLARSSIFALTTAFPHATRAGSVATVRMAVRERGTLGSASAPEAAYTLDAGYALEPAEDGTGGWLAHRGLLDVPGSGPGDDWVGCQDSRS